ncbi:ANK_REP_REGION domain-containing protein [Caerostris extrusa]|uniref:ANK_REP_REGION domain-containing protein n=1 Tax=Caerostris extrusa TaxID=172846 RepID=A0AAV4XH33_CAEEX|nr:ANK_REP_REGION domain-containing protein [Caerostris extrusa]
MSLSPQWFWGRSFSCPIGEFIEEEDLFGCLNEPIHKGLRLLHYAVYQDEMGIMLLLDSDADPNVMDDLGFTPVHICAERKAIFT